MVLPAGNYAAQGTGRIIADYLADKLYRESLDRVILMNLAVFIFREAASVSSGVGLGTDTIMIFEGDRSLHSISGGAIRELEDCIPKLEESIYAHWEGHLRAPEWLTETLTGPVAPSATPAAD